MVISDAGERAARTTLGELGQLRNTLGYYLGKDDIESVWPIQIVLFANQREYAPHALPKPLVDGPDSVLGAWTADTALPHDLLREITRQLIQANAGRMPASVDQGLCDLMATIETGKKGGRTIGNAPASGELPAERMRAWARLDMLSSLPEFSVKLPVYFNNLQQGGDEDLASHNAFGTTSAQLAARAEAFLHAGNFAPFAPAGPPLILDRDFDQRKIAQPDMAPLFAALKAAGKDFPPNSPRGLLEQGTRPEVEQAAKANPKWAAPHAALAEFHNDPEGRAKELALAASLDPRNPVYWQDLAQAQEDAGQYSEADKSWKMAERNADDASRAKIHQERLGLEERRARAEIEDRQHQKAAVVEDLDRVKKAAEARLHAAEEAANKRNGGALPPGEKVVPWWSDEDGQKLSGALTDVECLKNGSVRLTVKPDAGAPVKFMIRDMHDLAVKGADQVRFACGVQKPAKPIRLVHDGRPDSLQGTAGNVRTVELP